VKQVTILSGKGGTGKTSLAASLVRLAGPCVAVDADVDAANLALLLPGTDGEDQPFLAGRRARIEASSCIGCLRCLDECPFHAISLSPEGLPAVDPVACEGCGVCAQWCTVDAVRFDPRRVGAWRVRRTASGPLVHAELDVGEDNSGKLVAHVRKEGARLAEEEGLDLVIIDGPPGIGCPVHASLGGCDLVVAVTEPGVAATHDLERLLDLARWFHAPAAVVLNKADLDFLSADTLRRMAAARGVPVLASLPFLPEVPRALARGRCLLDVEALRTPLRACQAGILDLLDQRSIGAGAPAEP